MLTIFVDPSGKAVTTEAAVERYLHTRASDIVSPVAVPRDMPMPWMLPIPPSGSPAPAVASS